MKNSLPEKTSTKDQYEKENEEVERLVKKSPTKKPPRTDKNRDRLKVEDPDLDNSKDKDLSMNYKDIGGSSSITKRVALKTILSFEFDEDELELEDEEEVEDDDDEDTTDNEEGEEETEESDDEEDDEEGDPSEEEKPETRPATDDAVLDAAIKLYERPAAELQHMLGSEDYSSGEKKAISQALKLKTRPKPPGWDRDEVFEEGVVKLKARHRFRRHLENWDAKQFADNLIYFKEKYINESLTESRGWYESYFKVMIHLVEEAWEQFQKEDFPPLDIEEVLENITEPDKEFDQESKKSLKSQTKEWRERLRRTGFKQIEVLIKKAKEASDEIENHLSNRAAWITTLQYILDGALEMKKTTTDEKGKKIASAIRSGFRKGAQYRGLPGPLHKDDGFKPQSPKWRLKDPRQLDEKDFAIIVHEAMECLKKPFLANDLVSYNPDMACRIALDYSIYTCDQGKYDNTIDVPTYNALLKLLLRVTKN